MRLKRIIKESDARADDAENAANSEADLIILGEPGEDGAALPPIDPSLPVFPLLGEVLALHGVPAALAETILAAIGEGAEAAEDGVTPRDPVTDLAGGLAACLGFAAFAGLWSGGSVALVGPPGVGKTTLAAKLAARARRGRAILLNTDTERRGAVAQLAEYAEVLGAGLHSATGVADLARTLRGRASRIIIDTSGVNPFDGEAVEQLGRLIRAARAEPLLVLPAGIEPDEAAAVAAAFRALPIRRLVATRLDMTRRLGGLLVAAAAGFDLVGGTVTPHFAYGLRPLTPVVLARRLISAALAPQRWTTG